MGAVIGRNHEVLNDIEQKTGATLKVCGTGSNSSLYVKGSIESQKRAILKIKEIVVRHNASLLFGDNILNNQQSYQRNSPVKLYSPHKTIFLNSYRN